MNMIWEWLERLLNPQPELVPCPVPVPKQRNR